MNKIKKKKKRIEILLLYTNNRWKREKSSVVVYMHFVLILDVYYEMHGLSNTDKWLRKAINSDIFLIRA